MPAKPLQIFRTGTHVAMSGAKLSFAASDLEQTAGAYDPALHEAPIVVGHPPADAPAYGWVGSLAYRDGALEAQPEQVDPAFAELVRAGRYKKISASFWSPDAPANPVPGVYYLRHVGFLGAVPPAVKGLRQAQFAAGAEGTVTVEFGEPGAWSIARALRALREWFIADKGLETADQVLPDYLVRDLEELAARPDPETEAAPAPMFSAPEEATVTEQEAAQLRAENERLKADAAEAAAAQVAAAAATRRAGIVSYVDGLAAEGRSLLTRRRAAVVELLAALPADQQLSFAEGDTTATLGAEALAREILAALPKDVPLGEAAKREAPAKDRAEFSEHDWAAAIDAHVAEFHSTTAQAVAAIRDGWRPTKTA